MNWRDIVEKEYTRLSHWKVKAVVQMEGFVSFVFTIHLKVSGKKMKSLLFGMFTYERKTALERCQCIGSDQKDQGVSK